MKRNVCHGVFGVFLFNVVLAALVTMVVAEGANAALLWVDIASGELIENGSEQYPFKTIQAAIGSASPGDTVKIKPGVYEENVEVSKHLTLSGSGPDSTIIRGKGGISLLINANLNVTIEKMTITRSTGNGIHVAQCSSAVDIIIRNIVSVSNTTNGLYQFGSCQGRILSTNSTFTNNMQNGALANIRGIFYNCLFTYNGQYGTRGQGFNNHTKVNYSNSYNNTSGNWNDTTLAFSTTVDPLYMDKETGDFRLQSISPCRNGGSPDQDSRNPDGSRNDMGAYGGPEAAGFYDGYGSTPVVTDLHVTPGSAPHGGTISITATGKAQ